jgi:hypothetical protein
MKFDDLVKSRHPVEKRSPGVCNFLGTLDSGFRRNDEKNAFSTFYETIKFRSMKGDTKMRKGLFVMLTIAFLLMLGLLGCGQKEQAKQENETAEQMEEQAELAPEIGEPKGAAQSGTPEEEADLEETVEGPHGRVFDEEKETDETEGLPEEELEEEYQEEEFPPEETEDE